VLSACVDRQVALDRENLLTAAGFTSRPADTPARRAELRTLPANRFVRQVRGDRVIYLYADPLVCSCLYVGDQAAFDRFRQDARRRAIVAEERLVAQPGDTLDFWGPDF
jgi:hypothetical protein